MTSSFPVAAGTPAPEWRGINHLALITNDMDATVRFYHGVLGARLVSTLATDTFRHYFFEFAPQCTVAFFQYTHHFSEQFTTPAGVPDDRRSQFDHLSFNLPDERSLELLQARLREAGCGVTEIVDHVVLRSIYFTDPNGIALEATWWVHDPTAEATDYSDRRFFSDRDPVRAVHELEATGALESTPQTVLA